MKKSLLLMFSLLALTACQSPPAAGTTRAKEQSAKAYLEALEKQMATHSAVQSKLSNEVDRIHADLLTTAQEMRGIKQRANDLSVAGESNRMAMAAIEAEIMEQRNVVLQCEKEAMEEAQKVATLRDALASEQSVREQDRAAAEEARARAVAEEAKKSGAVKEALAREQQLRERDQATLREREKQIDALRQALNERDQLLRAGAVASAAAKPAPEKPAPEKKPEESPKPAPAAVDLAPANRLIAQGNTLLRENKIDEAEKAFNEALAISPELVGARVGLAACRYTRADFDGAKDVLQQVLREDSRDAQALGLRGLISWREGDLSAATADLQKAVRQDPTDSQLQNYLGIVLFERKRQEPALEALRKAVELDAQNGEAHFNLSVVLASGDRSNLDEARTHYERALQLGSARDEAMDKILSPAGRAAP
jgi:Flp pilus assembly protein TadD